MAPNLEAGTADYWIMRDAREAARKAVKVQREEASIMSMLVMLRDESSKPEA